MSIVKHLPNAITSMNLLSGAVGVIFALEGRFDIAFPLMLASAVFDFLDGFAARMLNAYSAIGKELDSLADMVSFGLLPSLILYKLACLQGLPSLLCYIPLAIAVFSGLRLANFNIDENQHDQFIGLATPSCAMICASFAYFVNAEPDSWLAALAGSSWFIPVMAVILSVLLVSRIPMFSMKFGRDMNADAPTKMKRIAFITAFFLIVIAVIVMGTSWSLIVLLLFLFYILLNIAFLFVK